ncbi:hypothetical protein [Variovorax sp. LjRoot178]|uniref:hypothetical protein n=1 Tax=Variovorax sp. LjRoot178 TaxID=3342277 RepID=UPI003ECD22B4
MGKNTEKLIFNVDNQLHLMKIALTNYSEDVRIALKTPEFDCGVSMAAFRKREGAAGEARAKKIEAEAERIWKLHLPNVSACVKAAKGQLKILSDYVAKRKSASKLPWNSKSVTKAGSYIKATTEILDRVPSNMEALKKEMRMVAESVKTVAESINRTDKLAAELKEDSKDQSDD